MTPARLLAPGRRAAGALALAALALALVALAGCFNPFDPRIATTTGVYVPPPKPNSAQGVIQLFEWCWDNRDYSVYRELFTADFRFIFALGDSAGNQFRDHPVDRETELDIAQHLFVGGGGEPPANSIVLNLDPTLRALPDSRPGKDPGWHKEIVSSVDLTIKTDAQEYRIMGNARFFVVRGDSALIPTDLSLLPDANRWYIDQWNDETLGSTGPAAAMRAAGGSVAVPAMLLTITSVERRPRPGRASDLPLSISWGSLHALYQN